MHSPLIFFSIRVLLGQFGINYLIVSLGNNIFNLFFSKSFEVVWHKSVWGQLRFSCWEVLHHNVAHISSFDFSGILRLLVVSPVGFSLFLLSSEILVICLHILQHLVLACIVLVLHQTSHGCDGGSLFRVLSFLCGVVLILPLVLSGLFFHPFFLQLCIWGDTVAVACNLKKRIFSICDNRTLIFILHKCKIIHNTYSNLLLQIICSLRYILGLLFALNQLFQLFFSYCF